MNLPIEHRVVRIIAGAGLIYASVMLISRWFISREPILATEWDIPTALESLVSAGFLILLVSSVALFRLRAWGRWGFQIAALMLIAGIIGSRVGMFVLMMKHYGTTQPQSFSPSREILATLPRLIEECLPAAIAILILGQPQIALSLRPQSRGGFEVLPVEPIESGSH